VRANPGPQLGGGTLKLIVDFGDEQLKIARALRVVVAEVSPSPLSLMSCNAWTIR
jgi:hypothetical protein